MSEATAVSKSLPQNVPSQTVPHPSRLVRDLTLQEEKTEAAAVSNFKGERQNLLIPAKCSGSSSLSLLSLPSLHKGADEMLTRLTNLSAGRV